MWKPPSARFLIVALAVVALVASHGFVVYQLVAHRVLSLSVALGVIILIVIKHLGLLAPLYAWLRRYIRRQSSGDGKCPGDAH